MPRDTLPDPPEPTRLENVPDAVDKYRRAGCSIVFDGTNYTARANADGSAADGAALSKALREVEPTFPNSRLATLARLEELLNDALLCQYRNRLPTTSPKGKCKLIVTLSSEDGSVERYDFVRGS